MLAIDEMFMLIFRTFFYYVIVVIIFRLMGKREVGELSLLDIVVYIMIAEIAVLTIEDLDIFFGYGLIPMILLLIIQRLTAWISLKSPLFRTWFEGKPSIIIAQGKIDEYEMKKNRFNFDDLLQQLRENGTESINDVSYAILEPSGKLSIIEKVNQNKIQGKMNGLVLPLIVDGKIQEKALAEISESEKWLRSELKNRGYDNINKISFCSIDVNDEWYVDKKNEM
ncbi:Uncharacterized membrane protein YcaP, DUF421 family [Gracilibacillus kekensis]|uniref:Uncharacterized membrane protein YcaP, DUF421 family n=1 Tax=Gracilibacillus kekensis TaxID=1027249 RepID=A0A1M7NZ93_9BACI|nr:DUF421 domain-containing protein [Gracilibacillus kekensis]SHN09406.1 Uncharacterized membrane protein YcaP, DUF421 family [Gracilibacillus kekensis]